VRVALVTDRFPPDVGGLAGAVHRIAHGLAAAGDEVDVYAVGAPASDEAENGAVWTCRVPARRREDDTSAALLGLLVRRHEAAPYDVVHGFYLARAGFLAAYAARYLDLPSVVSARGNDLDRAALDPARAAFVLRALDLADRVTAVSADLARKAAALAPDARVEVVPNGVDARAFRPVRGDRALARRLGLEGREVVGFAGELRHKKGLTVLLPALSALARTRPVTLLAAGGVRADDEGYLALFRRDNPHLHVATTEMRAARDLPRVYALMDVFVHPSLHDGLPNAVLEALACARPLVASTAGGIPDVVRHDREGILVRPGDAEALSAGIAALLDDRPRARRLGRAGRERVLSAFTPAAEIARYRALYRDAAARRTARGGAFARASR
jgi:glycosyltransferase involved in cell wall biosynthesis